MGFYEVLIIYLAIGAPLGVYAIVRAKGSITRNVIALLAAYILFWPVFASLELVPQQTAGNGPNFFTNVLPSSVSTVEFSRTTFKASLREAGDRSFKREALEYFDRHAALSSALTSAVVQVSTPEIFEIVSHPKTDIASKCLFRRNLRKLSDHRGRAFADLIALAEDLMEQDRSVFRSTILNVKTDLPDPTIS